MIHSQVTSSWRQSGEDPQWEETFEVFVRDARNTVLNMCVVDTDAIVGPSMGSLKRTMTLAARRSKRRFESDSDSDSGSASDGDFNAADVKVAGGKDSVKALRTDKQANSWKGEKSLAKSAMSVMGRVKFEVGQLYDSPNVKLEETVSLFIFTYGQFD